MSIQPHTRPIWTRGVDIYLQIKKLKKAPRALVTVSRFIWGHENDKGSFYYNIHDREVFEKDTDTFINLEIIFFHLSVPVPRRL